MSPTIPLGSLTISQLTPENQIKPGDVVTIGVGQAKTNLLGRVLNITSDDSNYYSITLKGDNQPLPDASPYKVSGVTYKEVFTVPIAGFIVLFLSSIIGLAVIGIVTIALALVYALALHKNYDKPLEGKKATRAEKKAAYWEEQRNLYGGVDDLEDWIHENLVTQPNS